MNNKFSLFKPKSNDKPKRFLSVQDKNMKVILGKGYDTDISQIPHIPAYVHKVTGMRSKLHDIVTIFLVQEGESLMWVDEPVDPHDVHSFTGVLKAVYSRHQAGVDGTISISGYLHFEGDHKFLFHFPLHSDHM